MNVTFQNLRLFRQKLPGGMRNAWKSWKFHSEVNEKWDTSHWNLCYCLLLLIFLTIFRRKQDGL